MSRALICMALIVLSLHAAVSCAVTLINDSDDEWEISFKRLDEESAIFRLSAHQRATDSEAFGTGCKKISAISFKARNIKHDITLQFEGVAENEEMRLPIFASPDLPIPTNEPASWTSTIRQFFQQGFFSLGIIGSIPVGSSIGMSAGAKVGATLGTQVAQHLVINLNPLSRICFQSLLSFWSVNTGVTGGWFLGAFSGAVLAPVAFVVLWKGSEAICVYALQKSRETTQAITLEELQDSDWFLIEHSKDDETPK